MKAHFLQKWMFVLVPFMALTSISAAQEQVIHRGLGPEPDAIDIHQAQGLSAFNVLRDLHEGLLTRDVYGQPIAAIAERWQVSGEGLLWTFTLDPSARWSDGEAITATDFVTGWDYALDPMNASPTAHWLAPVESFEALDAQTFQVRLKKPTPWFEELLTLPVTFPHPGETLRFSGPFMLDRRVPGSEIRLSANPNYRAADQLWAERIVWHVTEDPGSELARFRAGELHITETVPPGRYRWLRQNLGDQLRVAPYLGSFFLAFNLSREPFADDSGNNPLALRQALSLAIDRELIVERVLGSGELPAWRLVPPGLPGWPEDQPPDWASDTEARIARAQALYEQAGYSRSNPLEVELRYNTSLSHRRMAAAVAAMWKQHLGVRSRLVNEEWKVFVTNRRHGRITEIVRGGWIADWSDAGNFLQLFESDSPLNYSFFVDTEFDALIQRAAGLPNRERQQLLWQAEQRVLDQQAIIPLYYYVSRHLVHPDIRGYEDNPMDIHLSRWLSLADDSETRP